MWYCHHQLLAELEVKSILDVPCGDLHWMSQVDLGPVMYTGEEEDGVLRRKGLE